MNRLRSIIAGQATAFSLQVAVLFVAARLLGSSGQGQFSIIFTAVYLCEALVCFGLNSGFLYFLSRDFPRHFKTVLRVALCHLLIALVAVAGGLLVLLQFEKDAVSSVLEFRYVFFMWLITYALAQLCLRLLLSAQEYFEANCVAAIMAGMTLAGMFIVAATVGVSVQGIVWASVVASTVAALFGYWRLSILAQARAPLAPWDPSVAPAAYRVAFRAMASNVAFLAFYRVDLFLVTYFLGLRSGGIYATAIAVVEAGQKVADWLATILAPKVAAGQDPAAELTRRFALMGATAAACLFLLPFSGIALGFPVLRRAFGADYSGLDWVVLALVPRSILHSVMVAHAAFLAGHGYTRFHPTAGWLALTSLIAVDLWAIPRFQLFGAIMGSSVGYALATMVVVVGVRQLVKATPAHAEGAAQVAASP